MSILIYTYKTWILTVYLVVFFTFSSATKCPSFVKFWLQVSFWPTSNMIYLFLSHILGAFKKRKNHILIIINYHFCSQFPQSPKVIALLHFCYFFKPILGKFFVCFSLYLLFNLFSVSKGHSVMNFWLSVHFGPT